MFKGLTKVIGLFLLLLFISGAFLIPVFHKAHCDDQSTAGGDSHCAICQIIHTPCINAYSPIRIIAAYCVIGVVNHEGSQFVAATLCTPSRARAPPVV